MNKKQFLSLALALLLGVCLHGAAAGTPEEPAPFRLGLQDNALDRLFDEKLMDPARSQVQLRTYQEQYSQA